MRVSTYVHVSLSLRPHGAVPTLHLECLHGVDRGQLYFTLCKIRTVLHEPQVCLYSLPLHNAWKSEEICL
jgi:hypothetical protein